MAKISYRDSFVERLCDRIGALIDGQCDEQSVIVSELRELAETNNPALKRYQTKGTISTAVPDAAFRHGSLFHFNDVEPVRTFRTSGTSGSVRGIAAYSPRGLELMHHSIITHARNELFDQLDRPVVLRLLPDSEAAPDSIMPYGMALLDSFFGDPQTSRCLVGAEGLDFQGLTAALDQAVREQQPVVMVGGSFVFVHLAEALNERQLAWQLPPGSRIVDAGGFKGRSREVDVDWLRAQFAMLFGVDGEHCSNLFGMTELASQLYDCSDQPLGPRGERPKGSEPYVWPEVRSPTSGERLYQGFGLLEVTDLAIIDRPCQILTGDWGRVGSEGVAITGRVISTESRGCALNYESPEALLGSLPRGLVND